MFLFFILSSARWPHLYSIAQGTSGFGCFMTQCSSLKTQCCDLKHRVRTVIYNYLWPKCCCFCSLRHCSCRGPGSCSCAGHREAHTAEPGQTAELLLVFSSPWACGFFVLEHTSPQCQIFLPGYSVCFPLEFLELQVMFYTFTLFFLSSHFFWNWVAGGRCTILFTLRHFVQVTGEYSIMQ